MSSKSHRPRDKDAAEDKHSKRDREGHRDGSRDGRDRSARPSWREESRQSDSKDSRNAPNGSSSKQPGGRSAATAVSTGARPGGAVLGSSVLGSAILEAAKRKAQEQAAAAAAAAAADAGDEAAGAAAAANGPRKRAKHEPIVWKSPAREQADNDQRPQSRPESLQERLQREAAEFKQQQQVKSAADGSTGHKGSNRGTKGSSAVHAGTPQKHRRRSRSRSRSRSSSASRSSSLGGEVKPAGARWNREEDAEDEQQQQKQQPDPPPTKSRWNQDDEEEGQAEVEEGEAVLTELGTVGSAVDEELEALNRREREELEAGSSDDGAVGVGPDLHSSDDEEGEELPFNKSMLEESRRVEEYERLNRISEGTYGVVHRARCKATGKIFALKKLKLEACKDGFPQTSIREMNVLLSLHHPNIVNVSEVVIGGRDQIYMVMEFVEHDLKYVLELQNAKKAPPFSIGQVKFLMKQLLEGVYYLHEHWVLHRDLKTSNLLYSNTGELKICDFGLARSYGSPLRTYTPMVVTLWYRSIERLLNEKHYSTALDMWSVGCIMAELILGEPLFQGRGEIDQIKQIFKVMGTPTEESWPGWEKLGDNVNMQWAPSENKLRSKFPTTFFGGSQPVLNETGFDLLSQLLEMNPQKRICAKDALQHPWFREAPRPVTAALMPGFPARHQQGKDAFRDKMGNPSPGAVGVKGFGL